MECENNPSTAKEKKEIFYDLNKWYSFTYNPEQQHNGDQLRYAKCRGHFYQLLLPLSQYGIEYEAVMELSEPRKVIRNETGARYHIHGILKFTKLKGIYYFLEQYQYILSRSGYSDFDTCDDLDWFKEYMKKQSKIFGKRDVTFSSSHTDLKPKEDDLIFEIDLNFNPELSSDSTVFKRNKKQYKK